MNPKKRAEPQRTLENGKIVEYQKIYKNRELFHFAGVIVGFIVERERESKRKSAECASDLRKWSAKITTFKDQPGEKSAELRAKTVAKLCGAQICRQIVKVYWTQL